MRLSQENQYLAPPLFSIAGDSYTELMN